MKKNVRNLVVSAGILFAILTLSGISAANSKVKVKEGTFVPVRLKQVVASESCQRDQYIDLEVSQDVTVDGKVVIKSGALVRGQIDQCEKAKIAGTPGAVRVVILSVQAVDGQNIPLRSAGSRTGEDKTMTAVGGGLICPVMFLQKGDPATYPAGTEFQAFTGGDREIEIIK
jgi:hypothetical protein